VKTIMRKLRILIGAGTLLLALKDLQAAPPTHGIASQVRADTGVAMPDPNGILPAGVGVYGRVTPTDPQGSTVRMEVELHQLPATFTGTANYVSSYVTSGSVAQTATVTGLAAGNYGWAYRVVDSQGLASAWVGASNPDFTVQAVTSGDDYPTDLASAPRDSVVDPWLFYNRECTSYVAWRMNRDHGTIAQPYYFTNYMIGPNNTSGHWGNAEKLGR